MTLIARAPQLNVNDETILVVQWLKAEGDLVKKGEAVGLLETSKAVSEFEAEGSGYFRPVAQPGDRVPVHGLLFLLTDAADEPVEPILAAHAAATASAAGCQPAATAEHEPGEKRWTRKAQLLAQKHGIRMEEIPAVGVVREADVEQFLRARQSSGGAGGQPAATADLIDGVFPTNRAERVLIVGGGRGAVQVLDVIYRTPRQRPVGILDDNPSATGKLVMGVQVLGPAALAPKLLRDGVFDSAVIAFSNDLQARARLFLELSGQGVPFTNVIDPSVKIHSNVAMGKGNVVIANCRFGACAIVGDNNFLSAFVNIEHHNVLGSHCTFGPGVMTSSRVIIGDRCRFGTGVFIEPGVKIGSESIVASGSIITGDVAARSIVKARVETVIRPLGG
jgi:sugar O-acyltransferase (sialic acid O-acetyltransferase NeuD family)